MPEPVTPFLIEVLGERPPGGRAPAFEHPELFVDEVRAFFRHVR